MVGLPFAGKSSLAKTIAECTGALLIRLDTINLERGIGLNGAAISDDDWQLTYREAYRRIADFLARGDSAVFDHGNFTRAEREQVRAIGPSAGAPLQFVYVRVSAEEARRRLLRNRQTQDRYDVRDDFELAVGIYEPPDGEPDIVRADEFAISTNKFHLRHGCCAVASRAPRGQHCRPSSWPGGGRRPA